MVDPDDTAPDATDADPPIAAIDSAVDTTAAAPAAALPQGQVTHVNTFAAFVPHAFAQGQQLLAACVLPFGLGQGGHRPSSDSDARAREIVRRQVEIDAAKARPNETEGQL